MYEKLDHTKFNADMYQSEVSSRLQADMSQCTPRNPTYRLIGGGVVLRLTFTRLQIVQESAGDDPTENTKLHLTCSYNPQFSILCIRVIQVEGLTNQSQVMNPYLRVSLLSETKPEQTKVSQVQKNTTELQFEEEFVFDDISQSDLETNVSAGFIYILLFGTSQDLLTYLGP